MTDESQAREIGRIQGTLEAHGARLTVIERDVKTVAAWVEQQRGGKAAMTGMLTTAAAFGAAIAEFLHWILRLPHK